MSKDDYLKQQLKESFLIIDSCLKCYYENDHHMYKPLAGQLRILFCDFQGRKDNSLLPRVFPQITLNILEPIDWSDKQSSSLKLLQNPDGSNRISSIPLEIKQYKNGLAIAELIPAKNEKLVDIPTWVNQYLTHYPTSLTVKDIIRNLADKGGGAHVDSNLSAQQRYMNQMTLVGRSFGEMFIIAMSKLAQRIGENIFEYEGVKIPTELTSEEHMSYKLDLIAHQDYSDALIHHSK